MSEYEDSLRDAADRLKKHMSILNREEWNFALQLWIEVLALESKAMERPRDEIYEDLEDVLSYPAGMIMNAVQLLEFLENNGILERVMDDFFPFHIARRIHRSGLTGGTKAHEMVLMHGWYEKGSRQATTRGVKKRIHDLKQKQASEDATRAQKSKQLERVRKAIRHMLQRYRNVHPLFTDIVVPALEEFLDRTKVG